jgi:hypothetical protein
MPSRLIREGILTSDRVEQLDMPAEVFYRRLMSKVDDHGLYDARASVLRTSLYPLRVDRVREADCSRWIAACEKAGLIALYEHDGKPFLQMLDTRWTARSTPKFPLPTDAGCKPLGTTVNSCTQPQTPVPVFGVVDVVVVDISAAPSGAELFDKQFWPAYPKKKAKDDALKAFLKRKPDAAMLNAMLAAIAWQSKTEDWMKDGGKFIPYPATWLNDGRWNDEAATTVVATVRPDRDPELIRREQDAQRAVPMSDAVRQQIAKLKGTVIPA